MRYIKHTGHTTAMQQAILNAGFHKGVKIKSVNIKIRATFQQSASQLRNSVCILEPVANVGGVNHVFQTTQRSLIPQAGSSTLDPNGLWTGLTIMSFTWSTTAKPGCAIVTDEAGLAILDLLGS